MASHEFRTPLSTILSSAYLVSKYQNTEEQPQRDKHLQRIISSVNMLTDILNDFLSVGKIEEGKISVRPALIDIPTWMQSLINELEPVLKNGQQIKYTHENDEQVALDPSLLKHIVQNLVSNAIKFSPENEAIDLRTNVTGERFTLLVTDRGIGVPEEDQKHLFERFFRSDNATHIQGTGLGLHIVDKYASLMDGDVTCTSILGQGTTFSVTLKSQIPAE
jgi:signal transduction histidine kinase